MNNDVVNPYMESNEHGLGRIAYAAYCASIGIRLLAFSELSNATQAGWVAAAQAVILAGPKLQERDFAAWLDGLRGKMCTPGRIMFTDCEHYKKTVDNQSIHPTGKSG